MRELVIDDGAGVLWCFICCALLHSRWCLVTRESGKVVCTPRHEACIGFLEGSGHLKGDREGVGAVPTRKWAGEGIQRVSDQ